MRIRIKKCLVTVFLILFVGFFPGLAPASQAQEIGSEVVEVPAAGLVFRSGEILGVSKTWFEQQGNIDKIKIVIPAQITGQPVTSIASNAFSPYNYERSCVQSSKYRLVELDMTQAKNLTSLGTQSFYYNKELSGTVDLSNTKIKEIGKSAFLDAVSLQKVILPQSVTTIDDQAFSSCSSLTTVSVPDSTDEFQLPQNLEKIGQSAFSKAFASDVRVKIPASVQVVGSQAFFSDKIKQVVVTRDATEGFSNYDNESFTNTFAIFKNNTALQAFRTATRNSARNVTAVVQVSFHLNGNVVSNQSKLAGQPFNAVKKTESDPFSFWIIDTTYQLPDPSVGVARAGYRTGWVYNSVGIKENSKVPTGTDRVDVYSAEAIVEPKVSPAVDGRPVLGQESQSQFSVVVTIDPEDSLQVSSAGVLVDHPLLKKNQGTDDDHVYFKYVWWDEKDSTAAGPRSRMEPELFSVSRSTRVMVDKSAIPIRQPSDERTGNDQYMVEIFGYHVVNGVERKFYQSKHNFIEFGEPMPGHTTNTCYTLQVTTRLAEKVIVTFDPQNGDDLVRQSVIKGAKAAQPVSPVKPQHQFAGWFTQPSGGQQIDFTTQVFATDTTLYAQWTLSDNEPESPAPAVDPSTTTILPVPKPLPAKPQVSPKKLPRTGC